MIEQISQQSGVTLKDILDFIDHSQDEIRELSASNELKDLEVRAVQLKLIQKDEEIEKIKRQLNSQMDENYKLKQYQEEILTVKAKEFQQQRIDNQQANIHTQINCYGVKSENLN